jgi:hypothetical protein
MKKFFLILAALTTPLLAQTPPTPTPDTETPADLSSSVYAAPEAPFRDRTAKPETSSAKKTAVAVVGTIAAITIGLLVSGSDTGKHIKPSEFRDKTAS